MKILTRILFKTKILGCFATTLILLIGCDQSIQTISLETILPTTSKSQTAPIAITQSPNQNRISNLLTIPSDCYVKDISPDVKWIAMSCPSGEKNELRLQKIGERVYETIMVDEQFDAIFSPDGKKLVVEQSLGKDILLFTVGDWSTPFTLVPKRDVEIGLYWSPDSQHLAATYLEKGQALSILDLDGKYVNLLTYNEVNREPGSEDYFGPSWSPDSVYIVYVITPTYNEPQPLQLWTINADTKEKKLIYAGKQDEIGINPIWSPSGDYISVEGALTDPEFKLYIFNVNSNNYSLLISTSRPANLYAWAPDGKQITICDSIGELSVVSLQTGKKTLIYPNCGIFVKWVDEKRIIFETPGTYYNDFSYDYINVVTLSQ